MKNPKILINYTVVLLLLTIGLATSGIFLTSSQEQLNQIEIEDFIYSTFMGGSNEDHIIDVTIDSQGNIIVTGQTLSPNFPILNAYQETFAGGLGDIHGVSGDAIVGKFDQDGQLLWSTFLGGSNKDGGIRVIVDDTDNIYVLGMTDSVDFPTTDDAYQSTFMGGNYDLFITKFAPNGSVIYSSYLGTTGHDAFSDCQIDSSNLLVIAGGTSSADFPVTPDANQPIFGGETDGFILRLSANCSSILYSTFLGGSGNDGIGAIAFDTQNNLIATGYSLSSDFPITDNAYQNTMSGVQRDIFIAKYDSSDQLTYATFFGGSHIEDCFGTTADSSGNMIMSGRTRSSDFPVANAYQENYSAIEVDGFVTKLSADGQELIFSSYFGGSAWDTLHHVEVDSSDNIITSGIGGPDGFPILNAFQEDHHGSVDVVIMVISPTGQPLFCSYLGGVGEDHPWHQTFSDNQLFIVGYTNSPDFLVSNNSYQQTLTGNQDGFIFRFDIDGYLAAIESTSSITTTQSVTTSGFEYLTLFLGLLIIIIFKVKKRNK